MTLLGDLGTSGLGDLGTGTLVPEVGLSGCKDCGGPKPSRSKLCRECRGERRRRRDRKRYANNPEPRREAFRKRYAADPERFREKQRTYIIENRLLVRAANAEASPRNKRARPPWETPEMRAANVAVYREAQDLMAAVPGSRFNVDHIEPLRGKDRCGLHVPWNLHVTTRLLNQLKRNDTGDGTMRPDKPCVGLLVYPDEQFTAEDFARKEPKMAQKTPLSVTQLKVVRFLFEITKPETGPESFVYEAMQMFPSKEKEDLTEMWTLIALDKGLPLDGPREPRERRCQSCGTEMPRKPGRAPKLCDGCAGREPEPDEAVEHAPEPQEPAEAYISSI